MTTGELPYYVYNGDLPKTLYRYRSLRSRSQFRNVMNEILGEQVFLAPLKSLNDPDEGRMLIRFPRDPVAAFEFFYATLTPAQQAAPNANALAANRVKNLVDSGYQVPR